MYRKYLPKRPSSNVEPFRTPSPTSAQTSRQYTPHLFCPETRVERTADLSRGHCTQTSKLVASPNTTYGARHRTDQHSSHCTGLLNSYKGPGISAHSFTGTTLRSKKDFCSRRAPKNWLDKVQTVTCVFITSLQCRKFKARKTDEKQIRYQHANCACNVITVAYSRSTIQHATRP